MNQKTQAFIYFSILMLIISCTPEKENTSLPPKSEFKTSIIIPEPSGKEHECSALKNGPILVEGCEGEGCSIILSDAPSIVDSVTLYEGAGTDTKKVGELKKCDLYFNLKPLLRFTAVTPVLVIKAQEDLLKHGISAGDKIYLTHAGGESSWFVCLGDKIFRDWSDDGAIGVSFYHPDDRDPGTSLVKLLEHQNINRPETWYSLTTKDGKKVYTNNTSISFNDKHRNIDEIKNECPNAEIPESLKKLFQQPHY
ncbi:MAG: hypothetical protein E2O68_07950 [Deltaproteobacteria bacterium]|nr:MAG: hypothetical protein E2O68_07950 [Deltaproteobacteria bacterium]